MRIVRLATRFSYSLMGALALISASPAALAGHEQMHQHGDSQRNQAGALIKTVREATERFRDVAAAEAEKYHLMFGCVSGPDSGAMGLHYANMALVLDGEIDATKPEIVIYEPTPSGRLRMTGADFLVTAEAWHANPDHKNAPELMGQLFHYFEAPNRFGLPPFYTLHVWAWKDNPHGAFVNWHPKVSCDSFDGPNP